MFHRIVNEVIDLLAASNSNPIDAVVTDGSFIALIHHRRMTVSGWVPGSNAVYTVPAGKKAVVVYALPGTIIQVGSDPNNRKWRLRDTLNNVDIGQFHNVGIFGFSNSNDGDPNAKPSAEAPTGAALSLDLWNSNSNPRQMGVAVILKIVDA